MAKSDYERKRAALISKVARNKAIQSFDNDSLALAEDKLNALTAYDFTTWVKDNPTREARWLWLEELHADWYGFRCRALKNLTDNYDILSRCHIQVHMTTEAWDTESMEKRAVIDGNADIVSSGYDGMFALSVDYADYEYKKDDYIERNDIADSIAYALTEAGFIACTDSIIVGTLELMGDGYGGFIRQDSDNGNTMIIA